MLPEFFISTHGARKGLADTAICDSRLRLFDLPPYRVDVAQDIIIREEDCGTEEFITVRAIGGKEQEAIVSLGERCIGRVAAEDIINPETGEVIVPPVMRLSAGQRCRRLKNAELREVKIRSVLTCDTEHGVCQKCYGINLATGRLVDIGEAIGIVAAQSIGEPGTQLTMRTFHTVELLVMTYPGSTQG